MTSVLAVVTNWSRPRNIPLVVEALSSQADVVVLDNAVPGQSLEDLKVQVGAEVWRVPKNLGPPCRFVPALADIEHQFVLFVDDDFLPGSKCVDVCLRTAERLNQEFATIGQIGRRFTSEDGTWRYRRKNSPRLRTGPCPCDMTCRTHFVRCSDVRHVLSLREQLLPQFREHVAVHDDILLCLSIQMATRFASVLIPTEGDQIKVSELDDHNPISRRKTHMQHRNELINACADAGWRSRWVDAWAKIRPTVDRSEREEVIEE